MTWHKGFVMAAAAMLLAAPDLASAQFSASYNFLKAVRERDGAKASELLDKPGSTIVNTRDASSGETALLIAAARRDISWMTFLLAKGANPNLADAAGTTPLIRATQLRFVDGAKLLLDQGALIDKTGENGETALIRAVHLKDGPMVRFLVSRGASPTRRDLTGMSALDYARRDARDSGFIDALETAKPAKAPSGPVQGPVF